MGGGGVRKREKEESRGLKKMKKAIKNGRGGRKILERLGNAWRRIQIVK